jgi:Cu-Zn family superoxide dismutase
MNAIVFFDRDNIRGDVKFHQCNNKTPTHISINLSGFKPNQTHAMHIHEYCDLTQGCTSAGGHYNPFNKKHGNWKIHGKNRHVGDLINNIKSDAKGNVIISFIDDLVSLHDTSNIYGRSLVIHDGVDDLGLGINPDSLITGNAGCRITCGIIGLTKVKHF